MVSGCAVFGMTHFVAGVTISEASTYLSNSGGGETNFHHVTSTSSNFVRFFRRAPGFGISVGVFTVMRKVGNTYLITEVFYPLLVLKYLGLKA